MTSDRPASHAARVQPVLPRLMVHGRVDTSRALRGHLVSTRSAPGDAIKCQSGTGPPVSTDNARRRSARLGVKVDHERRRTVSNGVRGRSDWKSQHLTVTCGRIRGKTLGFCLAERSRPEQKLAHGRAVFIEKSTRNTHNQILVAFIPIYIYTFLFSFNVV